MNRTVESDHKAEHLPDKNCVWHLYGAGLEHLGRNRRPEEYPLEPAGADEVLVRVDAVGLCASDFKIMNLGGSHPALTGRDLEQAPVILGHEAAVTVVQVGEKWASQYQVGQRLCLIPGTYHNGVCTAIGYELPGALETYMRLNAEHLQGDHGAYVVPLQEDTGYSEAALVEPWSCVANAYFIRPRTGFASGGTLCILGCGSGEEADYTFGNLFTRDSHPGSVLLADVPQALENRVRELCGQMGVPCAVWTWDTLNRQMSEAAPRGFDDIVCLGTPDRARLERLCGADVLNKGGILAVLSSQPMTEAAAFNCRRVHYDKVILMGAASTCIADAYRPTRQNYDLKPGGSVIMVGAGGPMGQMHIQRAVYRKTGPKLLVICDPDVKRGMALQERYSSYMEEQGRRLVVLDSAAYDEASLRGALLELNGGCPYDDIVICAPVGKLAPQYQPLLAPDGVLNIFAGIMKDFVQDMDLSPVYLSGQRWIGSCGPDYELFFRLVEEVEHGELDTDSSVAAIGGMNCVWDALKALTEGAFSGKTVIYPGLPDLPLMTLEETALRYPQVGAAMKQGRYWCRAAERVLLHELREKQ